MEFLIKPVPVSLFQVRAWTRDNYYTNNQPRIFNALSYRWKGGDEYRFGNEHAVAESGDVVFIPAGFAYQHESVYAQTISIQFMGDPGAEAKLEVFRHVPPEVPALFFSALKAYESSNVSGFYKAEACLNEILHALCAQQESRFDPRVAQCIREINQHYSEADFPIMRLAKNCGISEVYLRRLFVRELGCSPVQYLQSVRMKCARELLVFQHISIDKIAESCGFSSAKYFSDAFRKYTGVSPVQYRKSVLQK